VRDTRPDDDESQHAETDRAAMKRQRESTELAIEEAAIAARNQAARWEAMAALMQPKEPRMNNDRVSTKLVGDCE